MRRVGYFVEFPTVEGPSKPKSPQIPKLGEAYSKKAEEGKPDKPSSPPVPFSGVQEGTPASAFLPKGKERSELEGWILVKGHGV